MDYKDIGNDISEVNLSYLLLAQRLLREDRQGAMCRLGISSEVAGQLENLSLSQQLTLASSNFVLFRFRFDNDKILSLLTADDKNAALRQAHAAILLAAQKAEEVN